MLRRVNDIRCPDLTGLLNFPCDSVNFEAPMTTQVLPARTTAMRKPKAPATNRARILAAAIAEFASRGFKGASMDAIAARTNTTRALINYYFGSKEKLYLAVLERVYGEIRDAERELDLDHLPPVEAIRRIVEFTYNYYVEHEYFVRIVVAENQAKGRHMKRFPALRTANRLALVAGAVVLVAAAFVGTVMRPLADAGPLLPAHALLQRAAATGEAVAANAAAAAKVAAEQRCDACHATFDGVTATKCLQCHGDLANDATWRHPYLLDGKLGAVPGMASDEAFCTVCHTDHHGRDGFKPASAKLVGDCAACHGKPGESFDPKALVAKVPVALAPPQQLPYPTWRFPHDQHLAKDIACAVCHAIDPAVRERATCRLGLASRRL